MGGLLAPDQADMLAQGRDLHGELIGRYHSGPARDLWRDNPDARPVAEGGEIPKVFFRPSADQSARIDAFGNLFPGVSDAVPAFEAMRKYAIADLYGHGAGQNGHLKPEGFGNWIDARGGVEGGGAIGGLFSREQRDLLGDVNADVRRSADANNLGRATGSNTAQNLFSAGALLDSPFASVLAGKLGGGIGSGTLGVLRDAARRAALEKLGPALLDPATARAAIEAADKNTLYRLLADRLPQARNRAALQGLLYQNEDE